MNSPKNNTGAPFKSIRGARVNFAELKVLTTKKSDAALEVGDENFGAAVNDISL